MPPHPLSLILRPAIRPVGDRAPWADAVELLATGCLILSTVTILAAQISRAQDLQPSEPILVDLTGVQHLDPVAVTPRA